MVSTNIKQLNHALKEWAIAVKALGEGETIVLLRKGGIREKNRHFQVKHRQVWLYPTYEHQKPHLLKPQYASAVTPVESGWHPQTISIDYYAEITEILSLTEPNKVKLLHPYHIWNEQMISDRLKWKSDRPLAVLLLRVYRLAQPKILPYDSSYGGCNSWIDLLQPIPLEGLTPAIGDRDYQQQVAKIIDLLR